MGELARFRLLRNPGPGCGATPVVHAAQDSGQSPLLNSLLKIAGAVAPPQRASCTATDPTAPAVPVTNTVTQSTGPSANTAR